MASISERLNDPDATFTQQDIYAAFEELAERYGFHRDKDLPPRDQVAETAAMTVDGFEHLGVVIVRPRTVRDSMINIPSVVDRLLGDNMQPSQNSLYNATMVAIAKTLIVSPPNFADTVLGSLNIDDLKFFEAFSQQYSTWMAGRMEVAKEKKSGTGGKGSGRKSASSSATNETSSQPTLDGST